jgi:hypothetical protein
VARSEAHGHATMNDAQALMALVKDVIKAGAEDLNDVLTEFKDGVTIETQIKVDWATMVGILAALRMGVTPTVDEWPITLVNRIIMEEPGEKAKARA